MYPCILFICLIEDKAYFSSKLQQVLLEDSILHVHVKDHKGCWQVGTMEI